MALNTDTAVQLYMLMFGNIRVGLAIVQLAPDYPEHSPRVVDANPAARRISTLLSGDPESRAMNITSGDQ